MGRPAIDWSVGVLKSFCKVTATDCWEWQRGMSGSGYGIVRFRGRSTAAHRMAWMLAFGDIPDGLCVCHRCDNRRCCNPAHFFLGTQYDNNNDRAAKGRSAPLRGELNGMSKLTEDGVRLIRGLFAYGFDQDTIAGLFKLKQGYVSNIVRRKVWAHL